MTLMDIQDRLSRLQGIQADRTKRLQEIETLVDNLSTDKALLDDGVQVVLSVSHYIHNRLQFCISSIVTKAIQAIFDDPYEFQIQFNTRGDKTLEVMFALVKDGEELDPMTATGGGIVDVISFALRIACLLIAQPLVDKVLIFDEPFRFVSQDLQPKVRGMLEVLSKELGLQFLIITHERLLEE